MNIELLKEGCYVMAIGMGFVFFFLTLMIIVMNLSEKLLNILGKYFPEEVIEEKTTKKKNNDDESEIALAIACAIQKGASKC